MSQIAIPLPPELLAQRATDTSDLTARAASPAFQPDASQRRAEAERELKSKRRRSESANNSSTATSSPMLEAETGQSLTATSHASPGMTAEANPDALLGTLGQRHVQEANRTAVLGTESRMEQLMGDLVSQAREAPTDYPAFLTDAKQQARKLSDQALADPRLTAEGRASLKTYLTTTQRKLDIQLGTLGTQRTFDESRQAQQQRFSDYLGTGNLPAAHASFQAMQQSQVFAPEHLDAFHQQLQDSQLSQLAQQLDQQALGHLVEGDYTAARNVWKTAAAPEGLAHGVFERTRQKSLAGMDNAIAWHRAHAQLQDSPAALLRELDSAHLPHLTDEQQVQFRNAALIAQQELLPHAVQDLEDQITLHRSQGTLAGKTLDDLSPHLDDLTPEHRRLLQQHLDDAQDTTPGAFRARDARHGNLQQDLHLRTAAWQPTGDTDEDALSHLSLRNDAYQLPPGRRQRALESITQARDATPPNPNPGPLLTKAGELIDRSLAGTTAAWASADRPALTDARQQQQAAGLKQRLRRDVQQQLPQLKTEQDTASYIFNWLYNNNVRPPIPGQDSPQAQGSQTTPFTAEQPIADNAGPVQQIRLLSRPRDTGIPQPGIPQLIQSGLVQDQPPPPASDAEQANAANLQTQPPAPGGAEAAPQPEPLPPNVIPMQQAAAAKGKGGGGSGGTSAAQGPFDPDKAVSYVLDEVASNPLRGEKGLIGAWDSKTDPLNPQPRKMDSTKTSDCITFVTRALERGGVTLKESSKAKGEKLAAELADKEWVVIYFNRDTKSSVEYPPDLNDGETARRAKRAEDLAWQAFKVGAQARQNQRTGSKEKPLYQGSVPVDGAMIDFAPRHDPSVQQPIPPEIAAAKFGVIIGNQGRHCAMLVDGKIAEAHWDAETPPALYEHKDIFHDWSAVPDALTRHGGLLLLPPGSKVPDELKSNLLKLPAKMQDQKPLKR